MIWRKRDVFLKKLIWVPLFGPIIICLGCGWGGGPLDLCEQDIIYFLPTSLYTSPFTHIIVNCIFAGWCPKLNQVWCVCCQWQHDTLLPIVCEPIQDKQIWHRCGNVSGMNWQKCDLLADYTTEICRNRCKWERHWLCQTNVTSGRQDWPWCRLGDPMGQVGSSVTRHWPISLFLWQILLTLIALESILDIQKVPLNEHNLEQCYYFYVCFSTDKSSYKYKLALLYGCLKQCVVGLVFTIF